MSKIRNRGAPVEILVGQNNLPKPRREKKKKAKNEMHKMSAAEKKRWYLGVGKTSLGPFSTEGFGIGSGTAPANLGRARSIRNTLEGLPQAPEGAVRINTGKSQNVSNSFCRREMIGPINGNVSFGVTEWRINPGNADLFPWLSQISTLYEKYKVLSLSFVFVQTGSGFAAANVSGRCVMGCDYDVLTPAVASDQEAEMKDPSVPFAPYETAILRVNPQMLNKTPLFLRGAAYPPGSDPKTYDGGKLFFCSVGTPNADQIGTLYVDYEIEMLTPQLPDVKELASPNYNLGGFRVGSLLPIPTSGVQIPVTWIRQPGADGGALDITHVGGSDQFIFATGTYEFTGVIEFVATAAITAATVAVISGTESYTVSSRAGGSLANASVSLPFTFVMPMNNGDVLRILVSFIGAGAGPNISVDSRMWVKVM